MAVDVAGANAPHLVLVLVGLGHVSLQEARCFRPAVWIRDIRQGLLGAGCFESAYPILAHAYDMKHFFLCFF